MFRLKSFFLSLLVRCNVLNFGHALHLLTRHLDRTASIEVNGKLVPLDSIADSDGAVSYWNGCIPLKWWPGKDKHFHVSVDNCLPHPSQVDLLERLQAECPLSRAEIEEAIFEYYRKHIAPAGPTNWEGKPLRVAKSIEALRSTLGGPEVVVGEPFDEGPLEWSLDFGADWDCEHGVTLRFEGEKCVYVGN